MAIFDGAAHRPAEPSEWSLALSVEDLAEIHRLGGRSDIDACLPVLRDRARLRTIVSLVTDFAPDILLLQQPWLWPLAKICWPLLTNPKIVYSSHNDESSMLRDGVRDRAGASAAPLLRRAVEIEADLLDHSDGLIAVSRRDVETIDRRAMPTLVAPNGYAPRAIPDEDVAPEALSGRRYLLYISSAHAPNIKGFNDLAWPLLERMPEPCVVAVVGSICSVLPQDHPQLLLLGELSTDAVVLLISRCAGIILPVLEGGGSNLKTAEALYSRRPVIATRFAMRGYESYLGNHRLFVSEDNDGFIALCLHVLQHERDIEALPKLDDERRSALTWNETLKNVSGFVEGLARRRRGDRRTLRLRNLEMNAIAGAGWSSSAWTDRELRSSGNRCSILVPRGVNGTSLKIVLNRATGHAGLLAISDAAEPILDRLFEDDRPIWIDIPRVSFARSPLQELFMEATTAIGLDNTRAAGVNPTITLLELVFHW